MGMAGGWGNVPQLLLTVVVIIGYYIKRTVVERQRITLLEKNARGPLINFKA